MPFVLPADPVTGQIAPVSWGDAVRDALNFLANPPQCRATRSTAQSVPNATETLVAFPTETYDTDVMHDTVTNNSRITIKTAGVFSLSFVGQLAASGSYDRIRAFIRLNGATNLGGAQGAKTTGSIAPEINIAFDYKFAVNDYVEVILFQDGTGAAQNLAAGAAFTARWAGLG